MKYSFSFNAVELTQFDNETRMRYLDYDYPIEIIRDDKGYILDVKLAKFKITSESFKIKNIEITAKRKGYHAYCPICTMHMFTSFSFNICPVCYSYIYAHETGKSCKIYCNQIVETKELE